MDNVKGLFFKDQRLGARGLGAFGAAALSDGILNGCEVTISGGVATIGPGHIIIGGRVARISAPVQVGSVGAAFSRIVATVDLTRVSTKADFDQVRLSIETASTLAALMTGDTNDINLAGSTHKTWLWVYEATGTASLAVYQESYHYARARSKQLLWRNPSPSSGFAAQTLILPAMDGYRSFEIVFANTTTIDCNFITHRITVPDDSLLRTNADSSSPLYGKKYTSFDATSIYTNSSWTFVVCERGVYVYPDAHAIAFGKGYWDYPHANSSSYRGSTNNYLIPVEIYGMNTCMDMEP